MRPFLATAALVAAMSSPALADDPTSGGHPRIPSGDPTLTYEKYKLPNGLEVILSRDNTVPLVAVNVWYHVGSGDEVVGRSGFAHLFEHMMFQGSKNVGSDQHFKILREIGASEVNGTTNPDRTNYYEVVPSNYLETALWLESDRMSHMLDLLDRKALDNQIDVVRNERRQNYDNRPYRKALFALYAAMYPEGHPYRYLTIGKHEDLTAASVDDVKNFFRTWYVPSNATVAIVGDFDVAEAKKLVEKWFSTMPASTKPVEKKVPAPAQKPTTVSVDDSFAKQRQVTYVWHSPANYADGDAELSIAADALAGEGYGRLYKRLVLDKQLATSVSASQDGTTFSGTFDVTVTLRSEASMDEVKQIVMEEIAKVAAENLTDREVKRVVADAEASAIYRLQGLNARANALQGYNHYLGDPGKLTWDLDRYRNAKPDKIRTTFAKYVVPANAVTVITNPASTGGAK